MSEKVAARLRRHRLEAQTFFIGLRAADGWIGDRLQTPLPSSDGHEIMSLCRQVIGSETFTALVLMATFSTMLTIPMVSSKPGVARTTG